MSHDIREEPTPAGDRARQGQPATAGAGPAFRGGQRLGKADTIAVYRSLARFPRHPMAAFEDLGRRAGGGVVRLDLGLFRPYLVTSPEHVQHVLRDNAGNYLREGMLWSPVRRLIGDGISGEGPTWAARRRLMQPMFSGKYVASLVGRMAQAIAASVDALDTHARTGRPIDVAEQMTRIVSAALIRAFFGGRISAGDADRLGPAIATAFTSLGARMLMPFVPASVPLPGDRAFARAVRTVDEVMYPLVRERRRAADDDDDLVTMLCRARDEDGKALNNRQIRDDIVSIFVAATETTAMALTWLWVVLDGHPEVSVKLRDEVERVVGPAAPAPEHLGELRYTKMVLQELLRLYPVAWFFPRAAWAPDVVGGVRVEAGATIILSPYLTHRMSGVWDRPLAFDPERFAPGAAESRHRFSYFPFAAGPHQCLGSHLFTVEAQLIVATLLSRYRPELRRPSAVTARPAVTLRPGQRIGMVLHPAERR